MLPFLMVVAWAVLVAWLLFRAIRQFCTYEAIDPDHSLQDDEAPQLAVIIPARNEAREIERCLRSLLDQDYPAERLKIIVVDDNSTDETAAIVQRLAQSDARLKLIHGQPLADGWTGKTHACWQGTHAVEAEWLLFLDADTHTHPRLLRTALSAAHTRNLDMLSLEPFQVLGTFWERLIIPAGLLIVAFTQDLRRVNDPRKSDAAANGQCILIRRHTYAAIGGHQAVRAEICEDTALARLAKRSGYRLGLLGAEELVRTRMYTGFRSLWEGLSKNATETLGGVPASIRIALCSLLIGWLAVWWPLWATFRLIQIQSALTIAACGLAWCASLALLGIQLGTSRYLRIPIWYGFLFPLAYTIGAIIALNAVRGRLTGQVSWKGRTYSPPQTEAAVEP